MSKRVQLNTWVSQETKEKLNAHLLNPAKGHPNRGSLSTFIEAAILRELERNNDLLGDFFNGREEAE